MDLQPPTAYGVPLYFCIIFRGFCHYFFGFIALSPFFALAQQPPDVVRTPRINPPGPGDILIVAVTKRVEGSIYYLRGSVHVETTEMLLRADEVDYDEKTGDAEARGSVRFTFFDRGEKIEADRAVYNLKKETGRFFGVRGSSPPKIDLRPGLLTTSNPFVFQGDWAERLKGRYILYDGFVTNCLLPKPWWTLRSPKFDIVPGESAVAHKAVFRLRKMPLFYTPWFYKSLEEQPRKSGFLIPNFGHGSRRGWMVATGYYWAFHRSYDLTYRSQYFTERGFAHHADFRGKPSQTSEFSYYLYGVDDRGEKIEGSDERIKQGGYLMSFTGKADALPWGFQARGEMNYLSSFVFRQAFTESFNEAVQSQVKSIAYATRNWNTQSLTFLVERNENYQSFTDENLIAIRRLPAVEYTSRERRLFSKLPVWGSLESSFALVRRNQPLFQTRQFVDRIDFAPRLSTALRWKDFSLLPSLAIRETHWGSSFRDGQISGDGVLRSTREFTLDLAPPSLARVFDAPSWLGEKVKHVIEPRAGFRWVGGVQDFQRFVRFDETELLTNTKEVDFSITNRVYVKRGADVREVLTWQLWMKRYLDPDLGGAVVDGQRNVFLTQTEMTPYAFFSGPRRYSPVVSSLQMNPLPYFGFEWRSDYDPLRKRITNSALLANFRRDKFTVNMGHNHVRSVPALTPSANQVLGTVGWGRQDLRGWSAGFQTVYDIRSAVFQYATAQVSYSSDCCGISWQFRRFGVGLSTRNEWFRVSFAVSNIGSFGSLKRQERLF